VGRRDYFDNQAMAKSLNRQEGVTLQEIVIVMAIMAFLVTLLAVAFLWQLKKGRDGKRKSDLQKIKVAFEDYFNDYGCYPTELGAFANCGSREEYPVGFRPWLASIPCDPQGEPYKIVVEDAECPSWFILYAQMENEDDPSVAANECASGCPVGETVYNYALTSENISAAAVEITPTSPPPAGICGDSCFIRRGGTGPCNGPRGEADGPCPEEPGDRCFMSDPAAEDPCADACEVASCVCDEAGCDYVPLGEPD